MPGPNTAIIRHGRTFRGRTVTDYSFASGTERFKHLHQRFPRCFAVRTELIIRLRFVKTLCLLPGYLLLYTGRHSAAPLGCQEIPHRPSMRDLRRHVNQLQSMLSKGPGNGCGGEDEHMLVINLVVRHFLDHVSEVRILENQYAVQLEQFSDTSRHRRETWNMAHHIRRQYHVGTPALCNDTLSQALIEEFTDRLNTLGARNIGDIHRRFDSKVTMTSLLEVTQHNSIIAAQLDNERIRTSSQDRFDHGIGQRFKVHLHVAGSARMKSIVAVEHLFRRRLLRYLKHSAFFAEHRRQFKKILRAHFIRHKEAVSNGHPPKRHERMNTGITDST